MTQIRLDPRASLIILDVKLEGKITLHARLVLDTGASFVVLSKRMVQELGLRLNPKHVISTTTASKVEQVPLTSILKVTTLAQTARNVPCLVKDLPSESGVDGLLGLSFLRHFTLTLDFVHGKLSLLD